MEKFDIPAMSLSVLSQQDFIIQNSDIRGGRKSLLTNKSKYIPKLESQTDLQYDAMCNMTPFYILSPKVVDGFVGTIFAKPPVMPKSEKLSKKIKKNCDLLGNSVDKFSKNIIKEVLENGFCASLNDHSKNLKSSFVKFIKADQFVSFIFNTDGDFPKLKQFIYKEEVESLSGDFDSAINTKYIVLDLAINPDSEDKKEVYRSRTFIEDTEEKGKMILEKSAFPTIDNEYFDSIPMKIHGVDVNNYKIDKSILQDISDMNISVIQRTVDQTYMLHWTALPTAWITGVDTDDAPATIGPSKAWQISNPDAKVGMLEFSGNSARAHQDFIDNLKDVMAQMGAQILKKEGVSRETATSVLVRTAQQTSLVAILVDNVSEQLKEVYELLFEWNGDEIDEDFDYNLNSDFIKIDMEPNAQIALVKSWLDGAISHESLFDKMKEGELIKPNKTFEDELTAIKKNPPPLFLENLKLENSKGDGSGSGQGTNDIKGSNLGNGNVDNKLASENA